VLQFRVTSTQFIYTKIPQRAKKLVVFPLF
jgi:hypothetical protein